MLTISPVDETNFESVKSFLQVVGKEQVKSSNIILAAKDGDDILGVGIISFMNEWAIIKEIIIQPGLEMMQLDYGIGKALLNFIDRRSITEVYARLSVGNTPFEKTLQKLRFNLLDGEKAPLPFKNYKKVFYLNLENYFTAHCC